MIWYSLAISLHVIAALVWLAPATYRVLFETPLARREARAAPIAQRRGVANASWRLGWLCLGALLASGAFVLYYQGVTMQELVSGRLFADRFGQLLGAKLGLTAVLILLQLVARRRALLDWSVVVLGFTVIGISAVMIR